MKLIITLCLLISCTALAASEETTNRTFDAVAGGSLVVDVDWGSIAVTADPAAAKVEVSVWRKVTRRNTEAEEQFLREHPVQFLRRGDTVTVRCRGRESNSWFGGWRNRNEAKYTVRLPVQFNARLDTSGGDIAVDGLAGGVTANTSGGGLRLARIHGPLHGGTSGGDIRVEDCRGPTRVSTSGGGIEVSGGGGSLNGDTSGGDVSVRHFDGPASVSTSGGGITLENINGKVDGSTSGGPVTAALLSPLPGDVALSTSGGDVTVRVPGNSKFTVDAETSGGGVTCDLPVTVQGRIEPDQLRGAVNGGGLKVVLRSSGGGIHILKP